MLVPGRIYVNGTVRLAVNFSDDNGEDVNPDTVEFKVRSPAGITTSYVYGTDDELAQTSTGDYHIDYSPSTAGRWHYRWISTGTAKASVVEGSFVVQASMFTADAEWDAYRS